MSQGNIVFTNKRSDSLCSVREIMYSQAHKRITDLYNSSNKSKWYAEWSVLTKILGTNKCSDVCTREVMY